MAAWGGPDVRSIDSDEETKMLIVAKRKIKDIGKQTRLFLMAEKPHKGSRPVRKVQFF